MEQGKTTTAEVNPPRAHASSAHQPADGGRRLGGDACRRHRAARRRTRTLLEQEQRSAAPSSSRDRRLPRAGRGSLPHGDRRRDGDALTAATMLASSDQTSQRAEGAVIGSNEASMNVETAATAADELSVSISEISRQLAQTSDVVRSAVTEAKATNDEIASLAQVAQKIGDVVKLIQQHRRPDQSAGAQRHHRGGARRRGRRGFAVVASEVKSLAVQTGKATEEITRQITAVQTSTSDAVDGDPRHHRAHAGHQPLHLGGRRLDRAAEAATGEISRTSPAPRTAPRPSSPCSTKSPAARPRPAVRPKPCSPPRKRWSGHRRICAPRSRAFCARWRPDAARHQVNTPTSA